MTFWRTLLATLAKNPISFFAVLCVMATGIFLAHITLRLVNILTSPDFCARSLQAERITPGNTFVGLTSCVEMTMEQVKALANALLISISGSNLVLIVLIVVVVAGAKASFKAGKDGFEGNVGKDRPGESPIPVVIEQPPSQPVPTTDVAPGAPPMVDPSTLDPATGMSR